MATNLYDQSVVDYSAYFQYATKKLNTLTISNSGANRCARFFCQPNTLYHVSLFMDVRFRVIGYAKPNINSTTHYIIDPLDTNGTNKVGQTRTIDFQTNDTDTVLVIFYYTGTGKMTADDIRSTIVITVDEPVKPPVITIGTPSTGIISDEVGADQCTCSFTSDQDLSRWEARATLPGITPERGVGLLVESGTNLLAGTEGSIIVDDEELTNGDGVYTITVYGLSADGYWSDGTKEA